MICSSLMDSLYTVNMRYLHAVPVKPWGCESSFCTFPCFTYYFGWKGLGELSTLKAVKLCDGRGVAVGSMTFAMTYCVLSIFFLTDSLFSYLCASVFTVSVFYFFSTEHWSFGAMYLCSLRPFVFVLRTPVRTKGLKSQLY